MSTVDRIRAKLPGRLKGPAAGASAVPGGPTSELPPGGGVAVAPDDLLERRERLARDVAELHWDLGGLAYEMAARDHFRLDLLVRSAAQLQQVDAELGEVERLIRMEEAGAAGACPNCEALHGRGAVFCWQCGTELMATQEVSPAPVSGIGGRSGEGGRRDGEHAALELGHEGAGPRAERQSDDRPGAA